MVTFLHWVRGQLEQRNVAEFLEIKGLKGCMLSFIHLPREAWFPKVPENEHPGYTVVWLTGRTPSQWGENTRALWASSLLADDFRHIYFLPWAYRLSCRTNFYLIFYIYIYITVVNPHRILWSRYCFLSSSAALKRGSENGNELPKVIWFLVAHFEPRSLFSLTLVSQTCGQ